MPTSITDAALSAENSVVYPVSVKSSLMPLEPTTYTFNKVVNTQITLYDYALSVHEVELYSFALWGRVFATDGDEATPPFNSSNTLGPVRLNHLILLTGLFLFKKYLI